MEETKKLGNWSEQQEKYIRFLGRGKKDNKGNKYTKEQFAELIGVHWTTLYDWQNLPGFRQAVFEYSLGEYVDKLPDLIKSQYAKATGMELKAANGAKVKPGDTPAFMALMRQFDLLKSDKLDHTTNGRDMPAPILGGVAKGE